MELAPEYARSMVPSARTLVPQILVAGVLPLIGYVLLRPHVGSEWVALAIVMVFPAAEIVFHRVRNGRFEPIGIIALLGIAIGLIGAVALHGNATLLKVRDGLLTGVFGAVCLLSLLRRRPMMFYLGRAFASEDNPSASADFDQMWQLPTVARRFRFITALWGVCLVAEAVGRTILAIGVSTTLFLIVSPILNWGVIGALLWYTAAFSRTSTQRVIALVEADPTLAPALTSDSAELPIRARPSGVRAARMRGVDGAFMAEDFAELSAFVLNAWRSGVDRDWSVPAETLEWSCWTTADHTVDCVFSYAFFLASRRLDSYPPFGELHALPEATPADLVDGLRAATTMLSAVIAAADPNTRAVIGLWPHTMTGTPSDFAARGALEMILHAHDVCSGLGISFDPPRELCLRLRETVRDWPGQRSLPATDNPWTDLLERSGRPPAPGD
jgi:hypothetical protein